MAPRGTNPADRTNATSNGSTGTNGAPDSPAKRIFDQLALNHDGVLTLEEFSRAQFQQPTAK